MARTGNPLRWRRMSSANCSTDAYREPGSLRSALSTTLSSSPRNKIFNFAADFFDDWGMARMSVRTRLDVTRLRSGAEVPPRKSHAQIPKWNGCFPDKGIGPSEGDTELLRANRRRWRL